MTKREYAGFYIINKESGEVIKELDENTVLMHKNSIDAFKKIQDRIRKRGMDKRGRFIRLIHNENAVEKELSLAQCDALLQLFFCTSQKTANAIVNQIGEKAGMAMNQHDIAVYLAKSERQVSRVLEIFAELQVLFCDKRGKENVYLFNPDFFTTTKREGNKISFTKLFFNKLTEVSDKLKTKNERGALLKFMRYFHYQTYYLVKNPNYDVQIDPSKSIAKNLLLEENTGKLEHLNQGEFAEILGITRQATTKFIKSFEKSGAIKVEKQGREYRYIVHPDLMFRMDGNGEDDYSDTIRAQFKQLSKRKR